LRTPKDTGKSYPSSDLPEEPDLAAGFAFMLKIYTFVLYF